jgi:cation:H+ antiporter
MFAALLAYVYWQIRHSTHEKESIQPVSIPEEQYKTTATASVFLLLGLAGVALGADMLVRGAVQIAEIAGVPEAVIGMTIIAIGTSLPELTVAIAAARKKQGDMVLGNVIGSNVFNVLSILGLTALVKPLPINTNVMSNDVYFMIAVSIIFTIWTLFKPRQGRVMGIFMLAMYGLFLIWQY